MSERKGTKALELWCKRLVKDCPDVQIENMTTSWRNGIAFCALVHHFRPDLIDLTKLKPENVYENNQLAFTVAEKHLGIPALLDPEDMVESEVPDRLSILTYLSQFYQRLGHTVNTKMADVDSKSSSSNSPSTTPIKFGKSGLDKCAACGLPVYLAQRLIVSHKLYHRQCFRCSKCTGHINPKNFDIIDGLEFTCDSCKNEKNFSKFYHKNDHDQMGMLAFSDDVQVKAPELKKEDLSSSNLKARPLSILEKINMFEKNLDKNNRDVTDKISNLSLKDDIDISHRDISTHAPILNTSVEEKTNIDKVTPNLPIDSNFTNTEFKEKETSVKEDMPQVAYKSNINKYNFLQTQLSSSISENPKDVIETDVSIKHNDQDCSIDSQKSDACLNKNVDDDKDNSNIADDSRLPKSSTLVKSADVSLTIVSEPIESDTERKVSISVPPRRKKKECPEHKSTELPKNEEKKPLTKIYPNNLNPFSDDEEEEEKQQPVKKISTNPFGSSEEEDDEVPAIQAPHKNAINPQETTKRFIKAYNPFWSDGEEPSSDEEDQGSSSMYNSSMATSTPNLPSSTPRRRKAKAPPPPIISVTETPDNDQPSTSMDDVASISSLSSYNSTIHSDQKSYGKSTPRMKKKRIAPTPPDSISTMSGAGGSLDKGIDASGARSSISEGSRRAKGPAPGLPLPERREVKLQMSPEQLQVQLDLLETQQLGLERQGVLIEQMIRDKCEGDEPLTVPQEEVEDLVIQLCELVNEKNDLFRKQTELMYIRRQQRLEQEQADIEHEIRVIQSKSAVNRIDSDKTREEQLVSRLVEIVKLRDELVQQIDAERRRERQEDLAIATSIATKRAQRNSESNSSSMKSMEVITSPKKNKVKDKVKKQLKKAKHTLLSKKKDDSHEKKEDKAEKEKKAK